MLDFDNSFGKSQHFPIGFKHVTKKIWRILIKFYFHTLSIYSQILLNLLVNDHQFGYIKKLKKKPKKDTPGFYGEGDDRLFYTWEEWMFQLAQSNRLQD